MKRTLHGISLFPILIFLVVLISQPVYAGCDDPNPTHCPPPLPQCPPNCDGLSVPGVPSFGHAPVSAPNHPQPTLMTRLLEMWNLASRYILPTGFEPFITHR